MTLEEKIEQLGGRFRPGILDTTGKYNDTNAREALRQMFSVDSKASPRDVAILRNAMQRYLMEKTRLGIPSLMMGEALHGFMEYGSTSFPQALGLASTWDPHLVRQAFTAAALIQRSQRSGRARPLHTQYSCACREREGKSCVKRGILFLRSTSRCY